MTDAATMSVPLTDIGEGLSEAQVVSLLVAEGDRIERFDALLEVETDKAVVEITSPTAGRVERILVNEGDWVDVGASLLEIATSDV